MNSPHHIKYRVYLLNLDTCDKMLVGFYNNRLDAIKRAHGYHLLTNEAIIVQQLMNDDNEVDKWYTIHSKVKRR